MRQLVPGAAGLKQEERAEWIIQQHVMSIEMAYPNLIAKAWPSKEAARADLLAHVEPLIAELRKSNRDFYSRRIAAADERIQWYERQLPTAQNGEALKQERECRNQWQAALVANGGRVPEPSRPGKRKSAPPERYVPDEPQRRVRRKETPPVPAEMAIDSEGADPGDRAMQEAAKAEENAAREESRKKSLASQIELDDGGIIIGFESAGRSPSPFPGTMGAHTTAWIVHLDVIRRAILGKTVEVAIDNLRKLAKKAKETSRDMTKAGFEVYEQRLTESFGQLIYGLGSAQNALPEVQPILLQQAINSLLTYVNYIPGATIEAAETGGKGEGTIRNRLRRHKRGEPLTGKELRGDLLGLLDLREVTNHGQRLALLKNHLELVSDAYPECWEDSRLGKDRPEDVLEEWEQASRSAIEERDY